MITEAEVDDVVSALEAKHGLAVSGPRGNLALRARLDHALVELPRPEDEKKVPAWIDEIALRLRVHETRFYRDGTQLEALADAVLAPAVARGRCRVLSAGCSTGEETYTLAMMIARIAKGAAWEVVGLDASPASVAIARRGRYGKDVPEGLPLVLRRYLVGLADGCEIAPAVATRCRFIVGDLLEKTLGGPYDAIVCRNVLIYFEDAPAARVVERLARALVPGGALLVARAEVAVARRGTLVAESMRDTVLFRKPEVTPTRAPASVRPKRVPSEAPPPSRTFLSIGPGDRGDDIAQRGQRLLARGAALLEITIQGTMNDARLRDLGPPLRRLAAAATALGARIVPTDPGTRDALVTMSVL